MALTCIKRDLPALRAAMLAIALAAAPGAFAQAVDADVLAAREAAQKGQWRVFEQLRLHQDEREPDDMTLLSLELLPSSVRSSRLEQQAAI